MCVETESDVKCNTMHFVYVIFVIVSNIICMYACVKYVWFYVTTLGDS